MNLTDYVPPINPIIIERALHDYHSVTLVTVEPSALVYRALLNQTSNDSPSSSNVYVNRTIREISSQDAFGNHSPSNPPISPSTSSRLTGTSNQSNNAANQQTVLIKLIARFDPVKCRWRGPTRNQVQALMLHLDTLKAAELRQVPNFVSPIGIKPISLLEAELATPICDQPVDHDSIRSDEQCAVNDALSDPLEHQSSVDKPDLGRTDSQSNKPHGAKFRSYALITHEPIGWPLAEWSLKPRYQAGFPLSEVLPIALQLCATLNAIHKEPLPRRGLNSRTICYDPSTCRIQLFDYGLPSMEALENGEGPGRRATTRAPAESSDDDDESSDEDEKDDLMTRERASPSSASVPQSDTPTPLPHSAIMKLYVHGRWNFLCQCFMSPEQTGRIYRGVDSRSDIYSLGAIMYALLTGKLPFAWSSTSDPLELVHSIITSPVPSVRVHAPHVPLSLAAVVAKCMDKQPSERYQSVPGLEADLFRVYQQMLEFAQESDHFLPVPAVVTSTLPSRWNRRFSESRSDDDASPPTAVRMGSGQSSTSSRSLASPAAQQRHLGASPSLALRSFVQQLEESRPDLCITSRSSEEYVSPQSSPSSTESLDFDTSRIEREPLHLPSAATSFVTTCAEMPTDAELGLTDETSMSSPIFSTFPLGREDAPTRLFMSDRLYGRGKQRHAMNEAIAGLITHGGRRIIAVHGNSGMGKSALVRSVLSEVSSKFRNVLVLSSKIDMYNRTPFTMWKPIVNEAIINIFQQPSAVVAEWTTRILEAVGNNGALVTDLFPVLTRLIGHQKSVPELPADQAQHRVMSTLTAFLTKFCVGAKRPLIIWADDVQWSDTNSLALLENLAKQPIVSHVCFILAYRSEAVNEKHPAMCTISHLRTSLIPVTDIECPPLTLSDLQEFVQDCAHTSGDKALPIAIHLLSRSQGNPFFARQLLIQMQRDHQLVYRIYSPVVLGGKHGADEVYGEWGLASAASLAKTVRLQADMEDDAMIAQSESDVIKLVQSVITRLKPHVGHLLSLAAFLGSSFSVGDLAIVSETDISFVTHALTDAAAEELVEMSLCDTASALGGADISSMDGWPSTSSASQSSPHSGASGAMSKDDLTTYTFVHDRVQQACFDLIQDGDRAKTHLHTANLMLAEARKSDEYMASHQFHIAGHVVNSLSLLSPRSTEAREWAVFLADSAKRSEDMGSYASALDYVNAGAVLVGFDCLVDDHSSSPSSSAAMVKTIPASSDARAEKWRMNYAVTRDITLLRAKLLYQNQGFDRSIAELYDALPYMTDVLDRYEFHFFLQEVYICISRPDDALRINRVALAELGIDLPFRVNEISAEQLSESQKYEVTMENLAHLSYSAELVSMLMTEFDRKLGDRSIVSLIDELPPCTDRGDVAIGSLLSSIVSNCYVYAWEFTLPLSLLGAMHMLDRGIVGPHAHICTMLAAHLLSFPEIIRSGRPLALTDLGMSILKKYPQAWSEPKAKLTDAMVRLWYCPFAECDRLFTEARRSSTENGVQLFVSYCIVFQVGLHAWILSCAEMKAELAQFKLINEQASNDLMSGIRLDAYHVPLAMLDDPKFDIDDKEATMSAFDRAFVERARSVSYLCTLAYRVSRGATFYIMNQPRGAVEILGPAKLERTPGNIDNVDLIVLRILANTMLIRRMCVTDTYQALTESKIASCWTTIDSDMITLEAWNISSPATFGCMYALACAEIGFTKLVLDATERFPRSETQTTETADTPDDRCVIESHYRVAVRGFSFYKQVTNEQRSGHLDFLRQADQPSNTCMWLVGAANERYVEFCLFRDERELAMTLLVCSYNCWQRWGCRNKIRQLSRAYAVQFGDFLADLGIPDAVAVHPLTAAPLSVHRRLSAASSSTDVEAFLPPPTPPSIVHPDNEAYFSQLQASRDDRHELAMQRWWEDMMEGIGTSISPRSRSLSDPLERPEQPKQSDEFAPSSSLLPSSSPASAESDDMLHFADFDLRTVINATQAISREIVLSNLLSTVMTSLLRVSGSEKVILFSLNYAPTNQGSSPQSAHSSSSSPSDRSSAAESWQVDALLNVLESRRVYVRPSLTSLSHSASTSVLDETPSGTPHDQITFEDQYPQSVMNFVIHSQHPVILFDASVDPMFSRDPYIQKNKVKSMLCLPLMHRGGLTSALYLDNSTSAGLFRRERLLICKLIAAQATISIDNSRLYERVTRYARLLELRVAQRTEELEKASREAQEASKAKSMFLSTMSHEIRTPMNGVIGGCDLLASDSSNLTPEQLEVLSIVRTSADAMMTIINDILDLSKIEAGRCEIINTTFEVRECVESALDVVASKAHSKGLEIQYFCDLDVPFLIHSDYKRLTQCMFNLLSNAIKFTMKGEVTLTVSLQSGDPLASRDENDESPFVLKFCVRDTGIGISPEHQHLLFQPFSQVHHEMRRAGSTGLGLLICKLLVEMMGGQVGFETENGVGSQFWFTIKCAGSDTGRPVWLQECANICQSLSTGQPAVRPKCLLIHPYEITREWIVTVAAHWGIDVITVSDVLSACKLLLATPPVDFAAIMTDYRSLSRAEPVDAETGEPIVDRASSPHSPRENTPAWHDSFGDSDVYIRYTLDHVALESIGSAINKYLDHRHVTSHVPEIGLGPISLMNALRVRVQREVPGSHVLYISTPIKIAVLYRVLRKAVQEAASSNVLPSPAPPTHRRHISPETKSDDEHNPTDIECIMVVEDNPVNRKVLMRMLNRAGYQTSQIMIAENGAIAVDMLHEWLKTHDTSSTSQSSTDPSHPHRRTRVCMLLDLLMPIMGGIEACQRIRASPDISPHQQPYIIALTANAGPDDREKCLEAKMDSYLSKPVTLAELTKALRDAARGRKHV